MRAASDSFKLEGKMLRSSDGTEIFAEACGDYNKPHIVFLHGFACTASAFDSIFALPQMRENLYMVRYDSRAHGRSGKPEDEASYESKLYADDFKTVCDAFKLNKPIFAGWSYGGTTATDICANLSPLPISGIISIAALPWVGEVLSLISNPFTPYIVPRFISPESPTQALTAREEFVSAFVAPSRKDSIPFDEYQKWMGGATLLLPACAVHLPTRTQDPTGFKEQGEKGLPMCLIHGKEDLFFSVEELYKQLKPIYKNLEVHHLDGIGHMPFWEDPESFARIVIKFALKVNNA